MLAADASLVTTPVEREVSASSERAVETLSQQRPMPHARDAADPVDAAPAAASRTRVRVAGKFFYRGDEKFLIRGVTYGPFRPDQDGEVYATPAIVARDFAMIRAAGINCIRVYSAPPRWLLDLALENGLAVMVGIPWAQYVAFFDNPDLMRDCWKQVDLALDRCAGHPALMAFVVGNEIPGPIVRYYGHRRIERHLAAIAKRIRGRDPAALITYANYPTTEYLDLPFLDFVSFNVYLDFPDRYDAYLGRLHNIAGERPLVMSEIGMDSVYYGEPRQAEMLVQKIDAVFGGGCAGMFVFAWTDEWWRHGQDITEWKFGLVDAARQPRASYVAVREAYAKLPIVREREWPSVSVVVCTYNGSRTIGQTVRELLKLDYPDYEIIVVDDGSKDDAARIVQTAIDEAASGGPTCTLIRQANAGLSVARNVGMQTAKGEIVAYIDDDAWPDEHWLKHIVTTIVDHGHVGAGGPNIAPDGDGAIAECVAHSPGGPTHVLLTDFVAEHIPGCNMAFRRSALLAIGGFDAQFRIAGDDVDICWRLQDAGGTLGFSPAAQVFHHRRNSVRAFWKQQLNYGRAEADLERKWPEKYNAIGHATWSGRLYSKGVAWLFSSRRRIYHGVWGESLFQQVYHLPPSMIASLPMMPEWYLLYAALGATALLGLAWTPLLFIAVPLLLVLIAFAGQQAFAHASRAIFFRHPSLSTTGRFKRRALVAALYRMQPLARLIGRYANGLVPWRLRGTRGFAWPVASRVDAARKRWRTTAEHLSAFEAQLRTMGTCALRGSDFDAWDLEVRAGLFGAARLSLMTEDLQYGSQLLRFKIAPRVSPLSMGTMLFLAALSVLAVLAGHFMLAGLFGVIGLAAALLLLRECAASACTIRTVAQSMDESAAASPPAAEQERAS
jgi:GT2 family glycosyltransferase